MILAAIIGLLIIAVILWEAFETVVLPRRVVRRFRVTVLVYRSMWGPWRALAHHIRKRTRRESLLSYFGPLSILFLFVFWAVALIFGFGLLYYSANALAMNGTSVWTDIYLSGTTLFTLGLGDVVPHTSIGRFLAVAESGLGFGFLALILSYLPVIYQAFSRREVNIVLLDARAGSPPTAAELLRRHAGPLSVEPLELLLHDWERSSAEILESHISYPSVSYFRSQHNNESWLAALTAMLDVTSLLMSCVENTIARQSRLTFAMCRHTIVDLAQLFNAAPIRDTPDRLPPEEFNRLRDALQGAGFSVRDDEASREKLTKLRGMYEPFVLALSRYLFMELPPWILAKEITDNWRTSAWGRISGLAPSDRPEPDTHAD